MLGFVLAHIPWNAILNLELRRSYEASRHDLVLPSATTLSNICWRAYALTLDAIKQQLPSRIKGSLPLTGWTSTNKLAIMSVIADYMDRNCALSEVELGFDEVDHQFFSSFERELRMTGQRPTYWSKASHTFEGGAWSFWAYRRPFAWYYDW